MLAAVHGWLLVAYAAMVGLVEGPAQALAVAVLVTTAASGRLRGWRPGVAELGILAWALAGWVGTAVDDGPHSSAETTRPLLALTFLIGRRAIGTADRPMLAKLAWAFGIACVANAGYGLVQFVTDAPLPLVDLLLANERSAQIWIPNHVYHVHASSGLFYNRLKLAHVGMVGAFLIAVVALSDASSKRTRIVASAGGLLLGGGLLFTYARMAFVAVAGAAFVLAAVLRRYWVVGIVSAGTLVAGGAVLVTEAGQKRMATLAFDFRLRRTMAEAALRVFSEHPILGVGHGVYRNAVEALQLGTLTGVHLTSPHNLWLQVLAETGIVGFVGFNAAVFWCLYQVIRRVARRGRDADALLDRVALLGVLAILFVGLMHFSLHHAPVGLVFWTLAGVCVRPDKPATVEDGEEA